jgi:hypothetical protein
MSDAEWYEVPGYGEFPNAETARTAAREAAKGRDVEIQVYRCTRTLVRTVQRKVTIEEADVTPQA